MQTLDQTSFQLDPFSHSSGVKQFLSFFAITKRPPSLAFLGEILTGFSHLPYENISKIIKLQKDYSSPSRIRLPEEVMEDHSLYHFGGTCFALTYFLQAILCDCHFICYPFIAHMNRMTNAHCALVVLLDGKKYIADPGYLLNRPMEISKDTARCYYTEHTGIELRFSRDDEHFSLHTFNRNEIKFRYKFADVPLSTEEFLKFWWDSFYWPGMRSICLTRLNQEGMVYVHNNFVQVQNLQGKQKGYVQDLKLLVKETFKISPEWVERAQAAIPELITRGQEYGYYRKKETS